jgi:uncharacterized protein (DUF697 family)
VRARRRPPRHQEAAKVKFFSRNFTAPLSRSYVKARGKVRDVVAMTEMQSDGPCAKEHAQAILVVRRYTALSIPGGLIPVPYADVAAVTALQMVMLSRIARIYGVPFSRSKAKLLVSYLLLAVPQGLSTGYTWAVIGAFPSIKLIPGIGSIAGSLFMAIFGASVTFALGIVFMQHFASGGTLLDFDPDRELEHFHKELVEQVRQRVQMVQSKLPRMPFRRSKSTI